MTYRSRGRSHNEMLAAIVFAGFLVGFILYLCVGNYQRAKRAMERQRKRRLELEEEKRALALSPGGTSIGASDHRRRINFGNGPFDSPRSNYSGSSSMYTDEKGLTVGVGGVEVVGDNSHMLLGGNHGPGGRGFAVPQQRHAPGPPRDLLDDNGGQETYTGLRRSTSQGEMSV